MKMMRISFQKQLEIMEGVSLTILGKWWNISNLYKIEEQQ